MANRHLSRSIVLQSLYEWDFWGKHNGKLKEILKRRRGAPAQIPGHFVPRSLSAFHCVSPRSPTRTATAIRYFGKDACWPLRKNYITPCLLFCVRVFFLAARAPFLSSSFLSC